MSTKQEAALERLKNAAVITPAARLCALREARGLSEEALGEELGVSGPAVHGWEHGTTPRGANPALIEAWSRSAAASLGLGDEAAIPWSDWLSRKERAKLARLNKATVAARGAS